MTVGRRWRFRRDAVIQVTARAGVPQRVLADVFDLSQARVSAIVGGSDRPRIRQRPTPKTVATAGVSEN